MKSNTLFRLLFSFSISLIILLPKADAFDGGTFEYVQRITKKYEKTLTAFADTKNTLEIKKTIVPDGGIVQSQHLKGKPEHLIERNINDLPRVSYYSGNFFLKGSNNSDLKGYAFAFFRNDRKEPTYQNDDLIILAEYDFESDRTEIFFRIEENELKGIAHSDQMIMVLTKKGIPQRYEFDLSESYSRLKNAGLLN